MDNKNGEFIPIGIEDFQDQLNKEKPMVFQEKEIIEIRGSQFRVEKIFKSKITLKLLPQTPQQSFPHKRRE